MRKFIFSAAMLALVIAGFVSCKKTADTNNDNSEEQVCDGHNAENSLEWFGSYTGTIPCADCEGIDVIITLDSDQNYQITYTYQGKTGEPAVTSGKFTWDESGSTITLDSKTLPPHYFVGENTLTQLDMEGNRIDGEHADMYILHKVQVPELEQ